MTEYSVAAAKARLSELIERALKGEGVVITRHGQPVAELKALKPKPGPITQEDLDWLAARRVGRKLPKEDAATAVRRMRDEEWK